MTPMLAVPVIVTAQHVFLLIKAALWLPHSTKIKEIDCVYQIWQLEEEWTSQNCLDFSV